MTFSDPTVNFDSFKEQNMMSTDTNRYVYSFSNGTGSSEYLTEFLSQSYGFDVVSIQLSDYYAPAAYAAGGDGVAIMCEHPEEALKVIECMNIERGKEIYNTVVYGIEGTHWEFVDKEANTINTFGYDGPQRGSDYLYSAHKWTMGNTFNAYLNQGCSEETTEIAKEINESPTTIHSALAGISYDVTGISTQLEQITAIYTEYQQTLLNGSKGQDGWRAYYDEYVEKLQKAGLEEVLTEIQKQVDAFLAK